jgi:hypothetical protein
LGFSSILRKILNGQMNPGRMAMPGIFRKHSKGHTKRRKINHRRDFFDYEKTLGRAERSGQKGHAQEVP